MGVGRALLGLIHRENQPLQVPGQDRNNEPRPEISESTFELAPILVSEDIYGLGGQNRPGVQTFIDLDHGHTTHRVPSHEGTFDRRSAAPAGQKREVQVEKPSRRQGQHSRIKDPAVGNDHADIKVPCGFDGRDQLCGGTWLGNRELRIQSEYLDRRCFRCPRTAFGSIRLGDHKANIKLPGQRGESRDCGIRGPKKNDPGHSRPSASSRNSFNACLRTRLGSRSIRRYPSR